MDRQEALACAIIGTLECLRRADASVWRDDGSFDKSALDEASKLRAELHALYTRPHDEQ